MLKQFKNRINEYSQNFSWLSSNPSVGGPLFFAILSKKNCFRMKYGYTHVVVVIPKSLSNAKVIVDVYNPAERTVEATMPRFISFYTSQALVS